MSDYSFNPAQTRRVAIIGGNRIPFARSNTVYAHDSNQDLLVAALQGLVDRYNLHGQRLGEFAAGAVIKHSRDFNLARESLLSTTLSPQTPAYDVQQACGTGLEAALLVANKIALGQIEVGIAGGSDTTSDAPIGINESMRHSLLAANRAKGVGNKVKALLKVRPSMFFKPLLPRNGEPRTGLSMGEHCEEMAKRWQIKRLAQDELTLTSHQRLDAAYQRGFFDDLISPHRGLARDNNLRADTSLEKLAGLAPAYDRQDGTLTAGNSTPLTDGASVVLLASEEWAAAKGWPVLAYLRTGETAAVNFVDGTEGLLMAPAYAVPRMLKREGLSFSDFDFFEIHEAFAAQVLCTLKAWEDADYCRERLGLDAPLGAIDRAKMNVNGGSLGCGHPFAATGGRQLAALAKIIHENGGGRGLISICAAGGLGITAIVESSSIKNNNKETAMNAVSLEQAERVWLNAYLPGVPADIDAGIEDYPSLREVFLEHLDKFRERVAYVSIGTEMTYADWQVQGTAFAAWLQGQGVKKGDRVALMMPNCLQYPICLLGTILAGAVVVNVNPLYTSHELKHLLKDSEAETVVIFENFAHTLEKVITGSSVKRVVIAAIGDLLGTFKGAAMNFILRSVQKQVPAFKLPGALRFNQVLKQGRAQHHSPVTMALDDLAFLQYTGGTTGDAKGVMLSHRNIIANLLQAKAWVGDQLDQTQQETNVTLLPLYHIFSLTVNCLMFMCLGGRNILIANPRDVKRVQMILRKERFNGIAGVNTLFNGLLENKEFCARDFSALRMVIAGGMATHTAVAKRWKEVTGLPIIEGYGLTECSPVVSISPIDIARMREMEFTGSIGVPLPSTWVRFIREDGELADIGEQGELQVRGPQVMQGYWKRPKETAEVLDSDGWLSTGDIGVMDDRGYIRLVDRKKDMILVSGFNVYPNEIEDVVALHPGVGEVAAIGVEDPVSGEKVKIIVVRKDPNLTQEQILAHCREYLTGYKVPRYVEFRSTELPKTTVGKVLRRALR